MVNNNTKYHMITLFLNGQQKQQQITHGYLFLNVQQQKQITHGYLTYKWSTTKTNNTWLPYF